MSKPKIEIVDGKFAINSKATVYDCMDFLHGLNADCKDPPTRERWNKDRCLVRVKREKGNNLLTMRISSVYSPVILPKYYVTVDQYGVGQYTAAGQQPSNKIDFSCTIDQGGSNFIYALFNSACHDTELLKKTAWTADNVEDYVKDLEKKGPVNIAAYVRSQCFHLHGNGPFPLNVDRVKLRISTWVAKEGANALKLIGSSVYGGAPYNVQDGGITSNFIKITKAVAGPYIGRIKDGKLAIQKGDFANTCMRIVASHSFYSAGTKGEATFPNLLLFSMRPTTFDITVLSKTVNAQSSVEMSTEDIDRVKELGGILDDDHEHDVDVHEPDDELSESSREIKRQRLSEGQ